MSEQHKPPEGPDKSKLGVDHLLSSLLRRVSPTGSRESLASASRRTGPLPQAAVAGPSSRPASTNAQSLDANPARSGREALQIFLASGVSGPLKPLIDDITELFRAYKDTLAADSEYAALQAELEALLKTLNTSFTDDDPVAAELIGDLHGSIKDELDKISSRETEGAGRRFIQASGDLDKVEACYRLIHGNVHRATLKIVGSHGKILAQQGKDLVEYKKQVDELGKSAAKREIFSQEDLAGKELKGLKPSSAARYNSPEATNLRRECTPNTRTDVLFHLDHWRRDSNQGNIFWMNGMAGTGKTTIANTLCARLENEGKLGASFFCSRQLPECRAVKNILPTIAYQLARLSRAFHDALFNVLSSDPDLLVKNIPTQLEGLILVPLRNASPPLPADLMIVIDALDECEDQTAVEEILGVFMTQASALPIKVFVSSRPEEKIRNKIVDTTSRVVLHELDRKIVQEDIDAYLREELGTSVSDDQLTELVKRAGVLFIYAATVVRFIKEKKFASGQRERLKIVLNSSTHENKIDELYGAILESAFSNTRLLEGDKARMRLILHTVVCAQEPLTVGALAGFLPLGDFGLVLDALEPLWSVLHVSGSEATSLVTTLHASFPDYMFDSNRSKEYYCTATSHHGHLANLCLARIENNERKFNICRLESSYLADEQVPDLEERINNAIPSDLSYASQYWAVHLELGGPSADRVQPLEIFLTKRLLMWMEVLNLKKRMNTGVLSLEKTRKWCIDGGGSEALKGLIHDAWRFVTTFATNPVSRSTPHIYVSMLPFWPSSKLIGNCYIKRARGLAEVSGSGMTRRQLALLGVFGLGSPVLSVAFSSDGMRIVCGCYDGTISMWDVQSGKMVLGPLKGHTNWVNSVAFSPDGLRIASGSYDETIRLWDARSGKMALEPLKGHTREVKSVAFSPDSARVVSGSGDKTIRVWDVQSGQMVLGPLEGHTSYVYSVAFSPNGTCVVSGSRDETILVWDLQSGQAALGPLKGHTDPVNSVAFSPNGGQIVSGGDRTIRVWDAQNGKPILEPLKGHTDYVAAVAFSPDGTHIVSGSSDNSIRVWDARRRKLVLGPLEGHTNVVTSVAFSPDGMRIVSGSVDQTIRVWDAQSREVASEPCEGHTQSVKSVMFAPNGMRILSGSYDKTVRLWDLQSGKMVLGPLQALMITTDVRAIAFSPNARHIVFWSENKIRVAHLSRFDQIGANVRRYATRFVPMAPRPFVEPGYVSSLAFSPDSTRIVSASYKTIRVWDMQSGKMLLGPLEGHTSYVDSVAFSPNGMKIVSGSRDDTLRMWDAQNGKLLLGPFQGHTDDVESVAFSPNGMRVVSGSNDRTIRVWDAASGDMVLGPLEGHTELVWSVAFSPNGIYIVSGSMDKTIRVWAAQTGELVLGPLNGHTLLVCSVSFSPDSSHIVSGSEDKVIRVWRLPSPLLTANPEPSPATPSSSRAEADSPIFQPSFFHQTPGNMLLRWVLDEDGWVVDQDQHLLLWVPPDLRPILMMASNTHLISTRGSIRLDFDGAVIGESWASCYTPE